MGDGKEFKLNPEDVRECARKIPGSREVATFGETVLSFLVGMHDKKTVCRINIYLKTGTIGCCRVLGSDQVREVFRKVSSIQGLSRIMQDPPKLTQFDTSLVFSENGEPDISSKMELAELGVCILVGEKEKLQVHLKALEEEDTSAENDDSSEEDDTFEGMEFEFSLPDDVMEQVEQCLEDIARMGKFVTCVAVNGKGAVFLYGNGGVAYTPGIPKQLYHKLKALKTNSRATRPCYVSIGGRERYYVSFLDGTSDWRGPKGLGQNLKRSRKQPRSVAFGSTYDTFFIVYDDGSWEYQGRGIPQELEDKLKDRSDRADLVCVTLGPRGEWFLRAQNGRMWWGGVGQALDELVHNLLESERYLNYLDFGDDGTYFISYD